MSLNRASQSPEGRGKLNISERYQESGNYLSEGAFFQSLRRHLYLNWMWKRLGVDFRCLVLISVTLLDLKNLAPLHMTGLSRFVEVYAIVRLKHSSTKIIPSTTEAMNTKSNKIHHVTPRSRTLDSQLTEPCRVDHSHQHSVEIRNTNPPRTGLSGEPLSSEPSPSYVALSSASRQHGFPWGSHVRFRIPLPDEILQNWSQGLGTYTKGPPSILYIGVYQKRPMIGDAHLGDIEVPLNRLSEDAPLEDWLPLHHDHSNNRNSGATAGLAAVSGANQQWFLSFRAEMNILRGTIDNT